MGRACADASEGADNQQSRWRGRIYIPYLFPLVLVCAGENKYTAENDTEHRGIEDAPRHVPVREDDDLARGSGKPRLCRWRNIAPHSLALQVRVLWSQFVENGRGNC